MSSHQLQSNRFELKYMIDELRAAAIRDFVRAYLVPDEYADPNNGYSYEISSLYLDSPDLHLCRATVQGHKNRFKLRIRFYNDDPTSPLFFEIKRRINGVILKERAAVRREMLSDLMSRRWPDRNDLHQGNDRSFAALQRFLELRDMLEADGRIFVSYSREAYVTPHDNSVRVTFDRGLNSGRFNRPLDRAPVEEWLQPKLDGVILELKYTDRFPLWMREMVRLFNLERVPMAKYVTCLMPLEGLTYEQLSQAPLRKVV